MALSLADTARQVLQNAYVLTVGSNAPPSAPATGDRHIVGTAATGAWAGHSNAFAKWSGSAWIFSDPDATSTWGAFSAFNSAFYGWTGAAWVAVSSTASQWNPDLPPAVANAMDDEFDAATLDAKWTVGNPGTNFAVDGGLGGGANSLDTTRKMLRVTSTGNAANRWGWCAQSLGAVTEGAFYTRVHPIGQAATSLRAGLLIAPAALLTTPLTTAFHVIQRYAFNASDFGAVSDNWTKFDTIGATTLKYTELPANYLRLRVNGTALERDGSDDGISWYRLAGSLTLPYTPGAVGLCYDYSLTGLTGICRFSFFRGITGAGTSGIDATQIGRLAAVPLAL